jgi:hypothetical protein
VSGFKKRADRLGSFKVELFVKPFSLIASKLPSL